MNKQSILSYMVDRLENGNLSDDFRLPEIDNGDSLRFADGAMDGIHVYHMGNAKISKEDMEEIGYAIKIAASGDTEKAEKLFSELGKKFRIISIIDEIQQYTVDHAADLDAGNVYRFAAHLTLESADRECVKAGLVLLELFDIPEEMKDYIRILGLSDEFTIFSLFVMRRWENGNMELLELGKRVHGWGKIHIVDFIEPENHEIKNWLLMDGIENNVMSSYSALECYEKADVDNIIKQPGIPYDQFHSICKIIEGLLDEGPVAGISEIENAEQMLVRLLEHAVKLMPLSVEDYDIINQISNWQEETGDDDNPEMDSLTDQIFCDERCRKQISDEVKKGNNIRLAKELGIPYLEDLYKSMISDFDGTNSNCKYLMEDTEYRTKVVDLFTDKLPLKDMKKGPSDDLGLGADNKQYLALTFIMQELRSYPLLGIELVETGIHSPVVGNRNGAIRVMQEWVSDEKQSIEHMAPSLYQCLKEMVTLEVDEDIKEKMMELVEGKQDFN